MRIRSGGNLLLGDRTSNQYSVPAINWSHIGTVFEMDISFASSKVHVNVVIVNILL